MYPDHNGRPASQTVAIIPVKSLTECKQRLADRFEPEQRAALVLAMLADVIAVLQVAEWPEQIWVVSADPMILACAEEQGACGVIERQPGLNEAVTDALSLAFQRDLQAALVIHGDLPAITVAEVLMIKAELGESSAARVGVVGCRNGGTSALYLSPVTAMAPKFGINSGRAHLELAWANGLAVRQLQLPGFQCDIDVPADIDAFVKANHPGRTHQFLASVFAHKR